MTESTRVVLYLRQSERRPGEDEKTSLSIRSQEDRGRQWAASIGGTIVATITDHDLRGADPNRPGIRELLTTVTGQRVDALWLFALSRLARDLILQLMICRDLDQRVPWIHTDVEGDINDPFIRGIYGLMNEQSTRQQSAHSKAAFARRARDGGFPTGPAPMGFVRPYRLMVTRANGTSHERHTGEPMIDETIAPRVRELFARFADGASLHALADELARDGTGPRGGQWTRRTLQRVLQSPIYAGDIAHHGVVVAHNDAWAIVDRDTWSRVQRRFRRLTVIKGGERDSWLEGIVQHACGARMYYEAYGGTSKGHGGRFICRYEGEPGSPCRHGRSTIGQKLIENAVKVRVAADLANRRSSKDAVAFALDQAGGPDAIKRRAKIEKDLAAARTRWKRNHDRWSNDEKLPASVMDEEDALLAAAVARYPVELAALPDPPNIAAIESLSASLTTIEPLLSTMTGDELRALLDDLSASVAVSECGVRITYGVDPHERILRPALTPVPKWGKGLRLPAESGDSG